MLPRIVSVVGVMAAALTFAACPPTDEPVLIVNNSSGSTVLVVTDDASSPQFIDIVPSNTWAKIEAGLGDADCAPSAYVVTTTDHRFVARLGPPVCQGQRHEITAAQVAAAKTREPGPSPAVPVTGQYPVDTSEAGSPPQTQRLDG